MKNNFNIIFASILFITWGCSRKPEPVQEIKFTGDDIKVTWTLITNWTDNGGSKASFILENNGKQTLGENGWAMYFNQFDTNFKRGTANAPVSIENLGGDFCRLVPKANFILKPQQSDTITFEMNGTMIKWSDAPQGVYFVFYDIHGKEQQRVKVNNYVISPFTKPEQMNRSEMDVVPVPDAKYLFNEYRSVSWLDSNSLPPFIPAPKTYQYEKGNVTVNASSVIHYEKGLENEAEYLNKFLVRVLSSRLKMEESKSGGHGIILLKTTPVSISGITREAYSMEISPANGVIISGSDAAGVFYGVESLVSMMPASDFKKPASSLIFRAISVKDAPSFAYRGMHLDVARDFSKKASVLKLIDVMAFYKLNRLHLHLTDDEGWRLEIKELPELTQFGSKRGHTITEENYLHPSYGSGPEPDSSESYGTGYYSREDFIEILQHAYKLHINVIPELEMPGHARAAVKSMEARFKKLMVEGKKDEAEKYRLIDPNDKSVYSSAQNYHDNVVCVTRESVYTFYSTVLDDIIQMYKDAGVPLVMWHVAGDEVPSGSWEGSPMAREFMKNNPSIKSARELQPYFFGRIIKIVEDKKLPIGGWEEMAMKPTTNGKWVPNPEFAHKQIYPYVWNTVGRNMDIGYRLANAGYPVILCNVNKFYFDQAYNKDPREPGLYWGGFVGTKDAFGVDPYNLFLSLKETPNIRKHSLDTRKFENLKPEARKNIIGLQGEIWSETIKGEKMLEYDYLPKLIGLAYSAWNGEPGWSAGHKQGSQIEQFNHSWNTFANLLGRHDLPRLDYLFGGYNYRISPPGIINAGGTIVANTEFPGMKIHYTVDGTEPTIESPIYSDPIRIKGIIKMKTFNSTGRGSLTTELIVK